MSPDDQLQHNIRRTAGQQALNQIRRIVDEENNKDAETARALQWLLRYGWIALLLIAAVLGRLMGVY
ncbi:MAG TPA: hypothetical protein VK149_06725 [Sideroxyarcus sp.]|nr:hypothetical protein [Sideroxyarcus sp.]